MYLLMVLAFRGMFSVIYAYTFGRSEALQARTR